MKYPRSWLDAAIAWMDCHPDDYEDNAIELLDSLDKIGALREIPKQREWWICLNHWEAGESTFETEEAGYCAKGNPGSMCNFVKTREVLDG